jgi:hypothetical protein
MYVLPAGSENFNMSQQMDTVRGDTRTGRLPDEGEEPGMVYKRAGLGMEE